MTFLKQWTFFSLLIQSYMKALMKKASKNRTAMIETGMRKQVAQQPQGTCAHSLEKNRSLWPVTTTPGKSQAYEVPPIELEAPHPFWWAAGGRGSPKDLRCLSAVGGRHRGEKNTNTNAWKAFIFILPKIPALVNRGLFCRPHSGVQWAVPVCAGGRELAVFLKLLLPARQPGLDTVLAWGSSLIDT